MNKLKKIDLETMDKIIKEDNSLFLCGNGFSMNFDRDFENIFDRLYEAHKQLIERGEYKANAPNSKFNEKGNESYRRVFDSIKNIKSKDDLYEIFYDGYMFAESIANNKHIIDEFENSRYILNLEFDKNQIDLLNEICFTGQNNQISKINIEYWSILIYFYFAIKSLKSHHYEFPEDNKFIRLIQLGHYKNINLIHDYSFQGEQIEDVLFNGFNTYYRLLFSIAIFNDGKCLELNDLNKLDSLSIQRIRKYLNNFNSIMTLNYDHILEKVLQNKRVHHLHGRFINKYTYVYGQNLGLKHQQNKYVSFSNILIGDYFYNKGTRNILNCMNENTNIKKQNNKHYSDILKENVKYNKINTFVIFGMSIQNDQHIIRGVIMALFFAKIQNPKIIYCYYSKEEAKQFDEEFKKCIKFSPEASEYARNIEVQYIDTHNILDKHFNK